VLAWQGILATQELSKSPNAKVVVIGSGKSACRLFGKRVSMKRLLLPILSLGLLAYALVPSGSL